MSSKRSAGSGAESLRGSRATIWSSRLTVLAQIAEVVAAGAVVVSLIYVGRELRSTTAAIQASSLQEATISSSQSLLNVATDSSLARIMQVGGQHPSQLTGLEAYRREVFMRQFWLIMQNVYLQNELGTIEPRAWGVYRRIVCDALANPGAETSWSIHRHLMDKGFTALIEDCP